MVVALRTLWVQGSTSRAVNVSNICLGRVSNEMLLLAEREGEERGEREEGGEGGEGTAEPEEVAVVVVAAMYTLYLLPSDGCNVTSMYTLLWAVSAHTLTLVSNCTALVAEAVVVLLLGRVVCLDIFLL